MEISKAKPRGRVDKKITAIGMFMLTLCVAIGVGATSIIMKDGIVEYAGAQKIMFETGKADGALNLTFFESKNNVYAVGPAAGLDGEITIFNSKSYVSKVHGASYKNDETLNHNALFLVWSQISRWKDIPVPHSIKSYVELQKFIKEQASASAMDVSKTIPFQVIGTPDELIWHINCDRTEGKPITRELFAKSKATYVWKNEPIDIIGFYSESHYGIFISQYAPAIKPDSGIKNNVHMHLVSNKSKVTGHVDDIVLGKNMTLRLPEK